MTQKQKELFEKDPLLKLMFENNLHNLKLVGGAVIDILEGRKVKDYDFLALSELEVLKLGFTYSHDTKTATTYTKGDLVVQRLKTNINDFDFKISQATLTWNYKKELQLSICNTSFENKVLIPCETAWKEKKNALNSLRRIPHWRKKGYEISDVTYLSLLSIVGKNNNYNS